MAQCLLPCFTVPALAEVKSCTNGFLHSCREGHRYSTVSGLLRETRVSYIFIDRPPYLACPVTRKPLIVVVVEGLVAFVTSLYQYLARGTW